MKKLLTILGLFLISNVAFSQSSPCKEDICVVQFNAGWNSANDVKWVGELSDCGVKYIDIAANAKMKEKYQIVVVPTIIVFNGEEVKRFQADISFAMKATKKDIQNVVDEILMEGF
tara:strand:+ start:1576 stop:1923 length:348 start_codon:yes stop_codon:yes gene_type:complete